MKLHIPNQKGSMLAVKIIFFCLVPIFSGGCAVTTGGYYLKGSTRVKQSDHVVCLGIPNSDVEANCFILTFASRFTYVPVDSIENVPISVDSVKGTYQFYSEAPQPFENISIEHSHSQIFTNMVQGTNGLQRKAVMLPISTKASLVPEKYIVTKPSQNTLTHAGHMKFGQYKLNIQYQLNGTNYSCQFDVDYSKDNAPQLHGLWEWNAWNK